MLGVAFCPRCTRRRTVKDGRYQRHVNTLNAAGKPEICPRSGTEARDVHTIRGTKP